MGQGVLGNDLLPSWYLGMEETAQLKLNCALRLCYFLVAVGCTSISIILLTPERLNPTSAVKANYGIEPSEIDLGLRSAGIHHRFSFQISNRGNDTMMIMGAKSGCGYLLPDSLPMQIDAGSTADVWSTLHIPDTIHARSEYRMSIMLLSDSGWLRKIPVLFTVEPTGGHVHEDLQPIPVTME
jgi:hypothetical protein